MYEEPGLTRKLGHVPWIHKRTRLIHYYDGIAMSFPSMLGGCMMIAHRQEEILRKHYHHRRD